MSKPQEEKTFFVSRRGHQVGINQVDLKDIDIESDQTSSEIKRAPERAKDLPKKPIKTIESTPRSRLRFKRSFVVLIIILIATPIAIGEIVTAQYRGGSSSAEQKLSELVAKTVLPMQKKSSISAEQLRSTATAVNDIATQMCRGGLLDNMATLYPRAQAELDQCRAAQTKYMALTNGLYRLESQARYLEKVGSIMKTVTTPITDEYAVIGAQYTAWQTAADKLTKLSPPATMEGSHKELSARVAAIADQWSKLNSAHNSHNGTAFLEAEKALAGEYEAVRTASAGFAAPLKVTQTSVSNSYKALR